LEGTEVMIIDVIPNVSR